MYFSKLVVRDDGMLDPTQNLNQKLEFLGFIYHIDVYYSYIP